MSVNGKLHFKHVRDNRRLQQNIMRTLVLIVGVLITSAVVAVTTQSAHADDGQGQNSENSTSEEGFSTIYSSQSSTVYLSLLDNEDEDEDEISENEEIELEPIVYEVEQGDTLIKIAKNHETEWLRLWQRNEELEHPDKIHPGDMIVIPFADEELEERELPEPEIVEQLDAVEATVQRQPSAQPVAQPAQQQERAVQSSASTPVGSSAGNMYAPGYCTWYVKNRRPDLPNNLGNANTWVSRASSQGMSTGSTPRVGAVAYQPASSLGHVAYVEAVHNDGTVTVSEMNWGGWNTTGQRRVPASTFTAYIY